MLIIIFQLKKLKPSLLKWNNYINRHYKLMMRNNAATPGRHVENSGDPDHTEALTQIGPGALRHIQINNSSNNYIGEGKWR